MTPDVAEKNQRTRPGRKKAEVGLPASAQWVTFLLKEHTGDGLPTGLYAIFPS